MLKQADLLKWRICKNLHASEGTMKQRASPVDANVQRIDEGSRERTQWVQPEVKPLKRLNELTLQSGGIPGGGGTGGGGSTVVP